MLPHLCTSNTPRCTLRSFGELILLSRIKVKPFTFYIFCTLRCRDRLIDFIKKMRVNLAKISGFHNCVKLIVVSMLCKPFLFILPEKIVNRIKCKSKSCWVNFWIGSDGGLVTIFIFTIFVIICTHFDNTIKGIDLEPSRKRGFFITEIFRPTVYGIDLILAKSFVIFIHLGLGIFGRWKILLLTVLIKSLLKYNPGIIFNILFFNNWRKVFDGFLPNSLFKSITATLDRQIKTIKISIILSIFWVFTRDLFNLLNWFAGYKCFFFSSLLGLFLSS